MITSIKIKVLAVERLLSFHQFYFFLNCLIFIFVIHLQPGFSVRALLWSVCLILWKLSYRALSKNTVLKNSNDKTQGWNRMMKARWCGFIICVQWHALGRAEQAKYYEMARKEKELHMKIHPGWSARDNYATHTKKKKQHRVQQLQQPHKKIRHYNAHQIQQHNAGPPPSARNKEDLGKAWCLVLCYRYLDTWLCIGQVSTGLHNAKGNQCQSPYYIDI